MSERLSSESTGFNPHLAKSKLWSLVIFKQLLKHKKDSYKVIQQVKLAKLLERVSLPFKIFKCEIQTFFFVQIYKTENK